MQCIHYIEEVALFITLHIRATHTTSIMLSRCLSFLLSMGRSVLYRNFRNDPRIALPIYPLPGREVQEREEDFGQSKAGALDEGKLQREEILRLVLD